MDKKLSAVYRCTNKEECGIVFQITHTPIKDPDYQYLAVCPVCGEDIDYAYTGQREEFEK